MTLWQILSVAYPVDGRFRDEIQLTGGPGWIKSARFDIIAKAEGSPQLDTNKPGATVTDVDRGAVDRIRVMLRGLLAERFKLQMHHEMQQLPIYDLVMARSGGAFGPALRKSVGNCGSACGSIRMMSPGDVTATAVSMGSIAHTMSGWVGRTVFDRTGIAGDLDFTLNGPGTVCSTPARPRSSRRCRSSWASSSSRRGGPVDVLVVDSAERPTPD